MTSRAERPGIGSDDPALAATLLRGPGERTVEPPDLWAPDTDAVEPDHARELEGLTALFHQCPVGLIAADAAGRVLRINRAATALLNPLAPDDDLADLPRLLALLAPEAADALTSEPARLGRLARHRRLLAAAAGDPTGEPAGVEFQLVRIDADTVMVVVLDVSSQLELASRRRAAFVRSQRHVLAAAQDPSPNRVAPIRLGPVLEGLVATVDVAAAAIVLHRAGALRVTDLAGDRGDLLDPEPLMEMATRVHTSRAGLFLRDRSTTAPLWRGVGSIVALPVATARGVHGVVLAVRASDEPSFTTADLLQIEMCAGHVAFALERVAAGDDLHHLTALADREQQGLALHDHIIQNLFATGLRLERLAYEIGGAEPDERVLSTIGELDAVIRQLRETLAAPLAPAPQSPADR